MRRRFYLYYFGTNAYLGILIGVVAGIVVSFAVGLAVRQVAQGLLRSGEPRAGGDHLLSHGECSGERHPRRQRIVVPDQPFVHSRAGSVQAGPVLHLLAPRRFRRLGVLQISRRFDLRRRLPRGQDQRGQAEISRLQQLPHPAGRLRHRQYDDRSGRGDVCRLSRFREPGDRQPVAGRGPGGGDDIRAGWARCTGRSSARSPTPA